MRKSRVDCSYSSKDSVKRKADNPILKTSKMMPIIGNKLNPDLSD
jgi:hypothetical protein